MNRLKKICQNLKPGQALFLTKPSDVRYFSNFISLVADEREAMLLIGQGKKDQFAHLFYNSFSPIDKHPHISYKPGLHPQILEKNLSELAEKNKIKEVFIDFSSTFISEMKLLEKVGLQVKTFDTEKIWLQKMIKDESERKLTKKACLIAKKSFKRLQKRLEEGQSEIEIKHLLENIMTQLGSEQPAFPTIIAFGANTALPHHQPTSKKLKKNMPVLIDFGATYAGYRSDMTRSFWFGDKPNKKYLEIEKIVQHAYKAGVSMAKNCLDKSVSLIDKSAREVITEAGYGSEFCHTTGHGIGLEVHEQPSISWKNQTPLKSNVAFTIEPGVYLQGKFGIRHENTVVTTRSGLEELTK